MCMCKYYILTREIKEENKLCLFRGNAYGKHDHNNYIVSKRIVGQLKNYVDVCSSHT